MCTIAKGYPNPDDVLDEEDHEEDPTPIPIPTRAPTSSYGDLSFLQDKLLLDDKNCRRAENAILSGWQWRQQMDLKMVDGITLT